MILLGKLDVRGLEIVLYQKKDGDLKLDKEVEYFDNVVGELGFNIFCGDWVQVLDVVI